MLEQRTVDEETEATHHKLGSEALREQLVYLCEKIGCFIGRLGTPVKHLYIIMDDFP